MFNNYYWNLNYFSHIFIEFLHIIYAWIMNLWEDLRSSFHDWIFRYYDLKYRTLHDVIANSIPLQKRIAHNISSKFDWYNDVTNGKCSYHSPPHSLLVTSPGFWKLDEVKRNEWRGEWKEDAANRRIQDLRIQILRSMVEIYYQSPRKKILQLTVKLLLHSESTNTMFFPIFMNIFTIIYE